MNCPRCKTFGQVVELKNSVIDNIEIDICSECGGIWFDKQELGNVVNIDKAEAEKVSNMLSNTREIDKSQDTELECPNCNLPMFKYRYMYTSNIFIDSCDKCEGIWLDKGELLGIINYLEEASKVDPEKEAAVLAKVRQIKMEYQQREKEFVDSLVKLDDTAKNPVSKAFGELLQSIYSFLYKRGM